MHDTVTMATAFAVNTVPRRKNPRGIKGDFDLDSMIRKLKRTIADKPRKVKVLKERRLEFAASVRA